MKAISVNSINSKNIFIDEDIPVSKDGNIIIKIHAIGVNRLDLGWIESDLTQKDKILGVEVAGEVFDNGNDETYKVGEKVIALLDEGGYAEYTSVLSSRVMKMPKNLSYVEGASIPENYLTAFQTLFSVGNYEENQSVMIHAGASGVGLAATQLSKLVKNSMVLTTSSEKKVEECKKNGSDYAINYVKDDFSSEVNKITNGKGVNLVLDFIGKNYFNKNIDIISNDGKLVLIGSLSGSKVDNVNLMTIMKNHISIEGTLLSNRSDSYKSKLIEDFSNKYMSIFEERKIVPVINKVFQFKEANNAIEYMKGNKNIGKIILTLDKE